MWSGRPTARSISAHMRPAQGVVGGAAAFVHIVQHASLVSPEFGMNQPSPRPPPDGRGSPDSKTRIVPEGRGSPDSKTLGRSKEFVPRTPSHREGAGGGLRSSR